VGAWFEALDFEVVAEAVFGGFDVEDADDERGFAVAAWFGFEFGSGEVDFADFEG
jgi:hypothetical protein